NQRLNAPPLRSGMLTSVAPPFAPVVIPLTILSSILQSAPQTLFLPKRPRNDHPLDLVCALIDLRDFGVTHHPLDRELLHVSIAAEHLNGVIGHGDGGIRGER